MSLQRKNEQTNLGGYLLWLSSDFFFPNCNPKTH